MPKKDIYKLDNILVPAGWIVLFLWGPASAGILLSNFGPGPHLILCFAPVAMLVMGYRVRAKEQRYIALWRILEKTARITVGELVQSTHFSADEIKEGIRTINSTGHAFFAFENHSGVIVNSGLQQAGTTTALECPSCGATSEKRLFAEVGSIQCDYCGDTFERESPPQAHMEPPRQRSYEARQRHGEFNIGTFVMLCLFFWPAAMVYYFRHKA